MPGDKMIKTSKYCRTLALLIIMTMLFSGALPFRAEAAEGSRPAHEEVQKGGTDIEYSAAPTGFREKNGKTYYYINNKMQTGWKNINGKRYYFTTSGSNKGVMQTGRRKIGNYYYYLSPYMRTGLIQAGDIIVSTNDTETLTLHQLASVLNQAEPGDTGYLKIMRQTSGAYEEMAVEITFGS
jgi:hypothetical protein